MNGLQCAILKSNENVGKFLPNQLQVIHCRTRDHWIVASTINCKDGEVNIYDLLLSTVDKEVVANLFHSSSVKMMQTLKQVGSKDCGLFAIATATAIACGADPTRLVFNQASMRSHLAQCFTDKVNPYIPCVMNFNSCSYNNTVVLSV